MSAATKKLTAAIEEGYLVIRVPMNPTPVRSSTGKSRIIANSHGNKEVEVQVQGQSVFVGVNAYIYPG